MLSRASESTLCQILTTLGKGEKDLEIVRQTLCNMQDFTLQQTFLRFDRNGSKSISPQEIVDFMKDNKVFHISPAEAAELINFYDNDQNQMLNFEEFNQMLLPCEDNALATEVENRPAGAALGTHDTLTDIQECAITCIIDKELDLMRKINGLKKSLEASSDQGMAPAFQALAASGSGSADAKSIANFLA